MTDNMTVQLSHSRTRLASIVRRSSRPRRTGWGLALLIFTQIAVADEASRPFSHPNRIRYDGQCLTIDGKDTFIFSGSFHYFRCPKALWPERFAKIKAAGFNCVDTYIPWNVHERESPRNLNDFSQVDLRDLEDWLNMAETAGLYVIARPGPFICAEWDRGGFPGWLVTKRPADYQAGSWFRSNDPDYMAWSRHWYEALFPTLVRHQITHKAPGQTGIILVFVENEYDHYFKDKFQGAVAIKNLAEEALAQGIDVPLVTCETDCVNGSQDPVLRHVFNVRNEYPGWNVSSMAGHLEEQHRIQPDAPLMIGEAQGGWFSFVWDTPPIFPDKDYYREDQSPAQINNLTLFALQNGVTIFNYYMLFGGTNPGDRGAKDIVTSYDFNAPIRECGGVGEKYQRVAAIGQMLKEYGSRLVRSAVIKAKVTTDQPDVTAILRQCPDGARFLFVRSDQPDQARDGVAHVQPADGGKAIVFEYQLEPFGSKILFLPGGTDDAAQGKWLPASGPAVSRPDTLAKPVEIRQVQCKEDSGPNAWKTPAAGASLNALGIYDNRFIYYRADFILTDRNVSQALRARITYPTLAAGSRRAGKGTGDNVLVSINGITCAAADSMGDVLLPRETIHKGKNELVLLYQNAGYLKEGDWMEKEAGVRKVRLLPGAPADEMIAGWKMRIIQKPEIADRVPELASDFNDHDWRTVTVDKPESEQLTNGQTAVFRASFNLSQQDIKSGRTGLFLSQASDYGRMFVNGRNLGESHSKILSHTFDMAGAVKPGSNTLAIVVSCVDVLGHGGLGLAKLTWPEQTGIQPKGMLQYSDCPAGIAGQWSQVFQKAQGWQTRLIPDRSTPSQALLTWHQLSFQLPSVPSSDWVPWLARLDAFGDGFIYLNGHDIGRYQESGAQHDYYLPECWLNPGTNGQNVITLCLRPGSRGASIQSAEIMPYQVYAEKH